jgi:hypothetical protein
MQPVIGKQEDGMWAGKNLLLNVIKHVPNV